MKRTTKNAVLVLLAVLFLASALSVPAVAEEASNQIAGHTITVTAIGNGDLRVVASVFGTHSQMTKIGFPSVLLFERPNSNGSWSGVAAHSGKYNPNATAGSHTFTFTYQGVAGRQYHATSTNFAQDTLGSDTRGAVSPMITAS